MIDTIMRWVPILLLTTVTLPSTAQKVPFNRGVNLTRWFQADAVGSIQFSRYTYTDLEQIKSLGCDVIRLPINMHGMTNGAPEYVVDPLFYSFLDQVIDWAEELEIYLILDNHSFDVNENTLPSIENPLLKVWTQLAERYANRSNYLLYEVFNEPHGIDDEVWNKVQKRVIDAIRVIDKSHTIVVGGAGWNSYRNLEAIPDLGDDNLIYTFHFYDPFLFTHQGATWVTPSMQPLANVPFPHDPTSMPSLPPSLDGTWVAFNHAAYPYEGTAQRVRELIDIAVAFRDERGLPVYCGEFGVFIPNSPADDRVEWYRLVRTYLEEKDIPWTTWDYHNGFGLFNAGGNDLFEHDLSIPLLEALGLDVPDQTEYTKIADSTGLIIYDDFIGQGLVESGYGGRQNFYQESFPALGNFHLSWEEANQYDAISMNFRPIRNFTRLAQEGFALDFFVRSTIPGLSFDVRFIDSKLSESDRPWRMRYVVDEASANWNGEWQHLHLPLSSFSEHGAWDNAWFEPIGAFDWTEINQFQIVAEYGAIHSLEIDHVQITDLDTAMVQITSNNEQEDLSRIKIGPNPVNDHLLVQHELSTPTFIRLIDPLGRLLMSVQVDRNSFLDLSGLSPGIYHLVIDADLHQAKHFTISKL